MNEQRDRVLTSLPEAHRAKLETGRVSETSPSNDCQSLKKRCEF